jgi:hypothetical protein
MNPPIIIIEGYDVAILQTERDLAFHFEPWYVDETDHFQAFDSEGYILELFRESIRTERRFLFLNWNRTYDIVRARRKKPPIQESVLLRSLLIRYLERMAAAEIVPKEIENMPLQKIVRISARYSDG